MAWTKPPALDKGKCFEIYRKEILAWGELTDLPKSKQGIVVALSLPENHETHIRERVFDQIPLKDLKTAYAKTWSGVEPWSGVMEWCGFLEWFFGVVFWSHL